MDIWPQLFDQDWMSATGTLEHIFLDIMVFMASMFKLYVTIGLGLHPLPWWHLANVATKWPLSVPHCLH
jgi:hypothetical protein